MTIKRKTKSHPYLVEYFKVLPIYKKHIEKPKIKCLKNIYLLSELHFYEELNVIKTNYAFKGYAMSYNVEIMLKNTKQMEKLNLNQFILIQQQKQ